VNEITLKQIYISEFQTVILIIILSLFHKHRLFFWVCDSYDQVALLSNLPLLILYYIISKRSVAFIYTSYTLKYSVFNATYEFFLSVLLYDMFRPHWAIIRCFGAKAVPL
jgi:hypothetical protein